MSIDIRPIGVPERLDGADGAELGAYAELIRRLDEETLSTADLSRRPRELLEDLRESDYTKRIAFGAFDGGRLVGFAEVHWELDDEATTAYIPMLGVDATRRREGIGSRLLAAAETAARSAGHPTTVLSAEHLIDGDPAGTPRVRAPQGDASIAADAATARFAHAHGYALGQLYRISAMDVAGRDAEFRDRLAAASAAATDAYRVVCWTDRAPEDLVDSLAHAHERMSVDPPAGAIAYELEPWDAARVRDEDERSIASGRTKLTAAAVAPDGEVAGFTELSLLPDSPAVEQWDTIVLAPHRGHRLGMRIKLANLVALGDLDAARDRVYTWNADENEHMLAINVALGFRPFALESTWQRPAAKPPGAASGAADTAGSGATTGS
ncbi:GNAT superfamily N-acetyltransferase [Agromyces flavus]|uniref:Acetyltransferase (GNAT) family protein n=1 Tax=Agromyces flavus TaxID=589382 RepID=A0A1H1PTM5_9MICO|nr:GNAT family N-acetyltransferase [Agromyces flavus]MCP2367861.1 GNAT superfamily N-acetyltransferase [Agromyces flavus]GGI47322.1 GNAT family N-acetyltransferase [Agromyces flavus]SDS14701.1 Acetyltransferase (GNAT) family protein [Agromyces flavus]